MINYFKLFSLPNYSVDQIIRFSTEYQIMIFGYKPNINYLPNIIWLNRFGCNPAFYAYLGIFLKSWTFGWQSWDFIKLILIGNTEYYAEVKTGIVNNLIT